MALKLLKLATQSQCGSCITLASKELVRRWHGIEGVSKIEVETYTLEPVFGPGK